MRVDPAPQKGSAITPGGHFLISVSMSGTGLDVGCPVLAGSWWRVSVVVITERSGLPDGQAPSPSA